MVTLIKLFKKNPGFLLHRFKPSSYYYGLVLLYRNAIVALLPTVLVDVPEVQVPLMGIMLLAVQNLSLQLTGPVILFCHVFFFGREGGGVVLAMKGILGNLGKRLHGEHKWPIGSTCF